MPRPRGRSPIAACVSASIPCVMKRSSSVAAGVDHAERGVARAGERGRRLDERCSSASSDSSELSAMPAATSARRRARSIVPIAGMPPASTESASTKRGACSRTKERDLGFTRSWTLRAATFPAENPVDEFGETPQAASRVTETGPDGEDAGVAQGPNMSIRQKTGRSVAGMRHRDLAVIGGGARVVLWPTSLAMAAGSTPPAPPCTRVIFTGSAQSLVRRCWDVSRRFRCVSSASPPSIGGGSPVRQARRAGQGERERPARKACRERQAAMGSARRHGGDGTDGWSRSGGQQRRGRGCWCCGRDGADRCPRPGGRQRRGRAYGRDRVDGCCRSGGQQWRGWAYGRDRVDGCSGSGG